MVKIFPISDMHLNFQYSLNTSHKSPFTPEVMRKNFAFLKTGKDTVLLACGDIGERLQGIVWCERMLAEFPELRIVYTPGNHEFYGSNMQNTIFDLVVAGTTHPRLWVLDGVNKVEANIKDENGKEILRVVGGTLWTDFLHQAPEIMKNAPEVMNDYSQITFGENNKPLRPEHVLQIHYSIRKRMFDRFRTWGRFAAEHGVPLIAMSHHCPYMDVNLAKGDGYYMTDMSEQFMEAEFLPQYWFSGHTHESHVRREAFNGKLVTFISNQVGYPKELSTGYTKHCIIEV